MAALVFRSIRGDDTVPVDNLVVLMRKCYILFLTYSYLYLYLSKRLCNLSARSSMAPFLNSPFYDPVSRAAYRWGCRTGMYDKDKNKVITAQHNSARNGLLFLLRKT